MQVNDIMTSNFEMIESDEPVIEAAKKMSSLNVGILPVKKDSKIVGVITDRDIVIRVIAQEKDISSLHVKDVMSPDISFCTSEDDIEQAAQIMKEKKVRRLLVCNEQNIPVGIVSLGDLAAKSRAGQLAGETLEAVSQPCCPTR